MKTGEEGSASYGPFLMTLCTLEKLPHAQAEGLFLVKANKGGLEMGEAEAVCSGQGPRGRTLTNEAPGTRQNHGHGWLCHCTAWRGKSNPPSSP